MIETHSSGGIIINPHGDIALVSQKGLSWSLPKGHIDEGENQLQAAYREIKEETGLRQLQFVQSSPSYFRYKIGLDGTDDKSEKKHLHFFIFFTEEFTLKPEDSDNPEAIWVHYKDVCNKLTHSKDKTFFTEQIPIIEKYLDECIDIQTTTASKSEAKALASHLVTHKLAACVQIIDQVSSLYSWEDKIEHDTEYKLHIKSSRRFYKHIQTYILKTHSYDCPEFIVSSVSSYNSQYKQWLLSNLSM